MSRDVIAMLAMLAVVAAICLIVTALIYWFAPPAWHRAPPLRTTQAGAWLCVAPPSLLRPPQHRTHAPHRGVP
jgi:hypothetical protein